MHTTTFHLPKEERIDNSSEVRIHHNGDYSGDVEIVRDGHTVTVPMRVLIDLVSDYKRQVLCEAILMQSSEKILGL